MGDKLAVLVAVNRRSNLAEGQCDSILLGYAEAKRWRLGHFRRRAWTGDDSGQADWVPASWQVSAMDVRNGAVAWSTEGDPVESTGG